MNKWFESKNIANYAKTALLQAQKKIDQVLDIKEDDIIASSSLAASSSSLASASATTLTNHDELEDAASARLQRSASNTSVASKATTSIVTEATDSFFNTFLSPAKNEPEADAIQFDAFLNQTPPTPAISVPTLKAKKSSRSNKTNKPNNLSIIVSSASGVNNEEADKQSWIQSYVNASPTGSSHQEEALFTNSALFVSSSSSSSNSTANASAVLLSTSATSSASNATVLGSNEAVKSEMPRDEEESTIELVVAKEIDVGSTSVASLNFADDNKEEEEEEEKEDADKETEVQDKEKISDEKLDETMSASMANIESFTESVEFVREKFFAGFLFFPLY